MPKLVEAGLTLTLSCCGRRGGFLFALAGSCPERVLHRHFCAVAGAFALEQLDDVRVLVLVLDLPAALFLAHVGAVAILGVAYHQGTEGVGEVAGGLGAAVEVLVVLTVPGREDRAFLPRDLLFLLASVPEERIADAAQDDDLRARPVLVGLLVGAGWELAHVGRHRVAGHDEEHVAAAGAALIPLLELEA